MKKQFNYFFSIILFISFISCKEDSKSISNSYKESTHYFDCNSEQVYSGINNLKQWDIILTENDTVFNQVFFDTIRFDRDSVINTISYTWFKEGVADNFNWNSYLSNEKKLIQGQFDSVNMGYYKHQQLEHYWFFCKEDNLQHYIEYILTNPLTIRVISSSISINDLQNEFCKLLNISEKASELRP